MTRAIPRGRRFLFGPALLLLACQHALPKVSPPRAVPVSFVVQRGELEDRMILTGELEAATSENLEAPQVPGASNLSIAWLAEDGGMVKKGDRVVEFDASTLAGTLEDKRTAVLSAESELMSQIAQSDIELGEKIFAVEQKRAALEKTTAQASVPEDLEPQRTHQTNRLLLDQARDELARAEAELLAKRRTAELDRTIKAEKRARAERELAALTKQLEVLSLRASRDGLVQIGFNYFEGRKYVVGDQTRPGWTMASLPELSVMQVRARLYDVDDGAVAAGMAADCIFDAYPQRHFSGVVQKVSPAARSQTTEASRRFFDVVVILGQVEPEFKRPGLSVRIEVLRRRQKAVLIAPREAVVFSGKRNQVQLESGELAEVELDFCTETACAVRSGVIEGTRLSQRTPGGKGSL